MVDESGLESGVLMTLATRYPSDGIDVIVVNYKSPDDLDKFLNSYRKWEDLGSELWIVNVDPDPADLRVANAAFNIQGEVHLLRHNKNVGYARAVNDAAARGCREIIAIFNADTELTAGLLEDCSQALKYNQDWGVLGPRQVDDQGRITSAGIFGTLDAPLHRGWKQANSDEFGDVREAVTVSGSAYFVKRTVWDELTACPTYREVAPDAEGAFLPTDFYYEETWCSYHAQAHGHKVIYYGLATMIHRWHQAISSHGKEVWAAQKMKESQALFRTACDSHGILHD